MRALLTFVIPVAMLTTFPADALLGRGSWRLVAVVVAVAVVLLVADLSIVDLVATALHRRLLLTHRKSPRRTEAIVASLRGLRPPPFAPTRAGACWRQRFGHRQLGRKSRWCGSSFTKISSSRSASLVMKKTRRIGGRLEINQPAGFPPFCVEPCSSGVDRPREKGSLALWPGQGVDLPSQDEVEHDESENPDRCHWRAGVDQNDRRCRYPDRAKSDADPPNDLAKRWGPEHGHAEGNETYRHDCEPAKSKASKMPSVACHIITRVA